MKRSEAFPSKYISKDDLQSPVLATVKEVVKEAMPGDEGEVENVIYFSEDIKPFICNITNWMILEEAFGEESNDWVGKRIEMYWDPSVMFGTKRTGGRRVRKPTNGTGHGSPLDGLKTIRKQIKAAGGTVDPLTPSMIETPEQIAALIEAHRPILAAVLAASL